MPDSNGKLDKIAQEIKETDDILKENFNTIQSAKETDQVVIILGQTGHGKSTLLNWLGGASLYAFRIRDKDNIDMERIGIGAEGKDVVPIGHLGASETSLNSRTIDGIKYFDCAGFRDNRSYIREIGYAFCIKELFQRYSNVRIMIVTKDSEARATFFMEVARDLEVMFGKSNIERITKGLSFVATNVEPGRTSRGVQLQLDEAIRLLTGQEKDTQSALLSALKERVGVFHSSGVSLNDIPEDSDKKIYLDDKLSEKETKSNNKAKILENLDKSIHFDITDSKVGISISAGYRDHILKHVNQLNVGISKEMEKIKSNIFIPDIKALFETAESDDPIEQLRNRLEKFNDDIKGIIKENNYGIFLTRVCSVFENSDFKKISEYRRCLTVLEGIDHHIIPAISDWKIILRDISNYIEKKLTEIQQEEEKMLKRIQQLEHDLKQERARALALEKALEEHINNNEKLSKERAEKEENERKKADKDEKDARVKAVETLDKADKALGKRIDEIHIPVIPPIPNIQPLQTQIDTLVQFGQKVSQWSNSVATGMWGNERPQDAPGCHTQNHHHPIKTTPLTYP